MVQFLLLLMWDYDHGTIPPSLNAWDYDHGTIPPSLNVGL